MLHLRRQLGNRVGVRRARCLHRSLSKLLHQNLQLAGHAFRDIGARPVEVLLLFGVTNEIVELGVG